MLVLTRKASERITIGKDIVVTVVEIRGNKVRLGIQAPKHVSVDREEVAEMKQCEAFLEGLRREAVEHRDENLETWSDPLGGEEVSHSGYEIYETTLNPTSLLSAGSPL